MGLFDAFQFDPNSYDSGGLLANLRQRLQADNQPSPLDNAQWPAGPQGNYGQTQSVQIGGGPNAYQMPQFGLAPQPEQAAIPQNAQPAQYAPQQPQVPQPSQTFGGDSPSLTDKLLAGFTNFGAGGKSGGLIGALAGAGTGFATGQRQDPAGLQQQQLSATYQSLVATGVPKNLAMAATLNPKILEQIAPTYFDKAPKLQETGQDPLTGQKNFAQQVFKDGQLTLEPVTSAQGSSTSGGGFMAPGVAKVDSSLTGADYLKQFSPEVQAAVNDYVSGKTMPTGNPRQGFTAAVKQIAQKYGNDIGQPADDTTFAARRQMRTQLSSSAPASLGGQINIGNTAAGHLADLTEQALKLDNSDGFGIPLLAHGINAARGMASTDQSAKMESLKGAAQHYGQEITKFYAGSPGGVAERDRFIESVNGAKSPKELAAILQTEGELMRSRLDALGGQIKGVLGEDGAKQYPVLRPDGEAGLKKVEENVSRLKNGGASQTQNTTQPDRSAVEAEMRKRGLIK